jgi:hypothetical protein
MLFCSNQVVREGPSEEVPFKSEIEGREGVCGDREQEV